MRRFSFILLFSFAFALLGGCEMKCETEKTPAHKIADAVDDAVDAAKDAATKDHEVKIKIKKSD